MSFWFFKDREELLSASMAQWRDKNPGNFVKLAGPYAETIVEALGMKRMPKHIGICTGLMPERRGMNRFLARHGHNEESGST